LLSCRYDDRVRLTVTHEEVKLIRPFPKESTVFDYVYSLESSVWLPWRDTAPPQTLSPDLEYHEITITTLDVVRYTYLIDRLVQHHCPVLLVGPTGTGKSVYMKKYISQLDPAAWIYMTFGFSAQTSANVTQVSC
jgi:dynein heavy chain